MNKQRSPNTQATSKPVALSVAVTIVLVARVVTILAGVIFSLSCCVATTTSSKAQYVALLASWILLILWLGSLKLNSVAQSRFAINLSHRVTRLVSVVTGSPFYLVSYATITSTCLLALHYHVSNSKPSSVVLVIIPLCALVLFYSEIKNKRALAGRRCEIQFAGHGRNSTDPKHAHLAQSSCILFVFVSCEGCDRCDDRCESCYTCAICDSCEKCDNTCERCLYTCERCERCDSSGCEDGCNMGQG